jgi:Protein-L-isoaspartate(D-aspartate) O-methyltransferase (PCMT)
MVGPEGRAVGVEHIPELVSFSIDNIKKSAAAPLLEPGSLSLHVAGKFVQSNISYTIYYVYGTIGDLTSTFFLVGFTLNKTQVDI